MSSASNKLKPGKAKKLKPREAKSNQALGKQAKSDLAIVTAALPYANGSIHLGHLVEYIQADIFARFLKLTGKKALYICASDMHGTPIEVNAARAGMKPEQFVEKYWREHQLDFKKFLIEFDNYYKTHSPENQELSELFFRQLKKKGYIVIREIEQMYDAQAKRFLPDRFVKGTCPKCQAKDQYGDVCEKCGITYNPRELIHPYSTISNTKPILKKSRHYFFKLSLFAPELKKWLSDQQSKVQPEIAHQLKEWLDKGLEDWCISRDAPYFGFEIPGSELEAGALKYFYVWLDAPIGYISSTKNYCDTHLKSGKQGKKATWQDYWKKGQVYHFIGKDIVYFHYLFWPAMLKAMDLPLPEITTHGFLTIDGQKMSKSRGTFILAKDFNYPVEALRCYYASKLDRNVADLDLNFTDFVAFNNHVLLGNLGNFCYRVLIFAHKNYGGVTEIAANKSLEKQLNQLIKTVQKSYREQDFKSAVSAILVVSDLGNAYFQNNEPWKNKKLAAGAVGLAVNIARALAILASPILPEFSQKIFVSLGDKKRSWKDLSFSWQGRVNEVEKLVQPLEEIKPQIFPLQLAVGQVKSVIDHPNADSLFILTVDFAGLGQRQAVTSLKQNLPKSAFEHKTLVFCLNLKPAKFRGEQSTAMIIAAEEGKKIVLLEMKKSLAGEAVVPEGMTANTKLIEFNDFEKVELKIKDGKVLFQDKQLRSSSEEVMAKGLSNQAKVR